MTIMYNISHKSDNKVHPQSKGTDESEQKKEIKGDVTMYSEAKFQRQLRLIERQKKRENLAMVGTCRPKADILTSLYS